jgi:hypothetical protein
MISKNLKYKDFDGLTVEETFWFHLSNADIIVLDSTIPGGITPVLQKVMADGTDNAYIVETFQLLLAKAVGRRSEDGKRFVKNADITADFMQTNAWEAFLLDLLANAGDAVEWFNGVMPNNVQEEAAKNKASSVSTDELAKLGLLSAQLNTVDEDLLRRQNEVRQSGGKTYDIEAIPKKDAEMSLSDNMAHKILGVTPANGIVDEWATFEAEQAVYTDWRSFSPQQLLDMDDDFFTAVAGPIKPGMNKALIAIAMRRRARRNGN